MKVPLIGIPGRLIEDVGYGIPAHGVCSAYIDSVLAAGGNPIILPLVGDRPDLMVRYAELCDGFLFTGGEDVDPQRYKAARHPTVTRTSPQRDDLELGLFREARALGKPILGVCRGLQLINVALGGTLVQDIPSSIPYACTHVTKEEKWAEILHSVAISPGTILSQILGSPAAREVNSLHHQCIDRLGEGLVVSARSTTDDIIEGIESLSGSSWLVAVQWHPEVLWQDSDAGGLGLRWNVSLFEALVRASEVSQGATTGERSRTGPLA